MSFLLNSYRFVSVGGGGGGGGYARKIISNNGTGRHSSSNDTEHRQSITFAGWFNTNTVGSQAVLVSWAGRSEIRRFTNSLNILIQDSTATTAWSVSIPGVFTVGSWVHVYLQVDLSIPSAVVKINGTTVSAGSMSINTALVSGSGLIYTNTGNVQLLHEANAFIFDGLVSDLVDYHTTSAGKPSADFYAGGTGTDPTVIGTPFVVLGGTMTADERAGNAAQGWNDSYTPGSATITTNSTTYTNYNPNPEILLDAGFDNASLFALNTGFTISGSALNISGAAAFSTAFYNPSSNFGLVTAGVPLTLLCDVASANSLQFRIYLEEYTSGNVYLRNSPTFTEATLTPGFKTYSYTPGASCAKVQAYFQAVDAGLVAVIRSVSLKVT